MARWKWKETNRDCKITRTTAILLFFRLVVLPHRCQHTFIVASSSSLFIWLSNLAGSPHKPKRTVRSSRTNIMCSRERHRHSLSKPCHLVSYTTTTRISTTEKKKPTDFWCPTVTSLNSTPTESLRPSVRWFFIHVLNSFLSPRRPRCTSSSSLLVNCSSCAIACWIGFDCASKKLMVMNGLQHDERWIDRHWQWIARYLQLKCDSSQEAWNPVPVQLPWLPVPCLIVLVASFCLPAKTTCEKQAIRRRLGEQ